MEWTPDTKKIFGNLKYRNLRFRIHFILHPIFSRLKNTVIFNRARNYLTTNFIGRRIFSSTLIDWRQEYLETLRYSGLISLFDKLYRVNTSRPLNYMGVRKKREHLTNKTKSKKV